MSAAHATRGVLGAVAISYVILGGPVESSAVAERSRGELVMGTVLQVTVAAERESIAQTMATRAIAIARHWDDVLTTWREEGELARFNAAAGRGPVVVSADLAAALATMRRFAEETNRAFDPGVGPSVRHFSGISANENSTPPPASSSRILDHLRLSREHAELTAGAALDASGIGKGIALDAMATALRRVEGVRGAYFNFGGSSQLAFGTRADGTPWRIALTGLDGSRVHGLLALDGAASTSQSRIAGDESGPIIDPATGAVVAASRFATCLGPSATETEVWSTALVVRGSELIGAAERRSLEVLYEEPDSVVVTPSLARTLAVAASPRAIE